MLFTAIDDRVARDREDSDVTYFNALCLKLEMLTKVVTAAVVSCLEDDPDRHRYRLEHTLVRANSLGDWVSSLNDALTGPPAQFLKQEARPLVADLNRRVGRSDWRYQALSDLVSAARSIDAPAELGHRAALRQFFDIGTTIRNRGRAHGATTAAQCSAASPLLQGSIESVVENLALFRLSWVALHRNLSGKYRVSSLLGDSDPFNYLKTSRTDRLPNGIYCDFGGRHVRVPLIFPDTDAANIFFPNGNYKRHSFECLSYSTNEIRREDGSAWTDAPERPPPSETEGRPELDVFGDTFTNIPPPIVGYVRRESLERQIVEELHSTDHHPIVTLTGPGGIGKTTLAIAALQEIVGKPEALYEHVLWISARDVDLLEAGPHPVSPRVSSRKDIAEAAVELLQPLDHLDTRGKAEEYLVRHLSSGLDGSTLLVIDNFETVHAPEDVFKWLDTFVRPPNKVLITTRLREFVGDYYIEVSGMNDAEAKELISRHGRRLRIESLIGDEYVGKIIRESDGHPYVIKILLGQVAQERRAVSPQRIVASSEQILRALFERTYAALSPSAQRVFLLLSSWTVRIPEIAVEAVSLRPGNERFAVREALRELRRLSLTDQVKADDGTDLYFVGVPLAAAIYGRRKLETSQFRVGVEDDKRLLMEFGAGSHESVRRGVLPRIERFVGHVAREAASNAKVLEQRLPILEHIALSVPRSYALLADLVVEVGATNAFDRAKEYVRRFLENCDGRSKKDGWRKLAKLCARSGDPVGQIQALAQLATGPGASVEEKGEAANQINFVVSTLRASQQWRNRSPEVLPFIREVVEVMDAQRSRLSATDCSRLGWLLVNIGENDRAREVAVFGTQVDSENEYCWNLRERLGA